MDPMSTPLPLNVQLVALLAGHGVAAEERDHAVYVQSVARWANLWMWQTEGGTFLMELRATASGEEVVADRWAAIGTTPDDAVRDGLQAFCRGGFHVVLAALWGVLEPDQIDHELRTVGSASWDLYLGPYTTRVSVGVAPLVAPSGLVDRVLVALDGHLVGSSTHALRVYVAVVGGAVTIEALVDDEPSADVESAVANADWSFPAAGFASLRWFVMARQREPGPAHLIERTCTRESAQIPT